MISQVDEYVWRGPRPTAQELPSIAAKFKTVLSLEGIAEDAKEAKELPGLVLVSQPISTWEIYVAGITQDRLRKIVADISNAAKPILVHCQHGQDRTGLVIAAYEVIVRGWTKNAAMTEALAFGYRNWLNYGLNKTWENLISV
jgi:tyrosine-protein phosphatase SIW14